MDEENKNNSNNNNSDAVAGENLQITSIEDLTSYAQGKVVKFPDFAEGQPFIARVRRPSMLVLAKNGQIPNYLLKAAGDLFVNGASPDTEGEQAEALKDMYDICEIIAKATLLDPTYDSILEAGMTLSDDQIIAIFNYSQMGIKALDSFRAD